MWLIIFLLGKIFAIVAGVYSFKKLSRPYKMVLALIVIAAICESFGYYLSHYTSRRNNLWVFDFYILIDAWLMGGAAMYLVNNRKLKVFFMSLLIIQSVVWIMDVRAESLDAFVSLSMAVECIIMIFMYVVVLFNNSLYKTSNMFSQPVFWLCLSTILYYGCDIPFMGLHNYLNEKMPSLEVKLGYINTILDVIRYPMVGVSFILLGYKKERGLQPLTHAFQ